MATPSEVRVLSMGDANHGMRQQASSSAKGSGAAPRGATGQRKFGGGGEHSHGALRGRRDGVCRFAAVLGVSLRSRAASAEGDENSVASRRHASRQTSGPSNIAMSRIMRGSGSQGLAAAPPAEGASAPAARRLARAAPACSHGLAALTPAHAPNAQPFAVRPKIGRKPETKRRLHRLRRELGRISPAPSDPAHARASIVDAMARAGLPGWTVPAFADESTVRFADGSAQVTLITHVIVFNPGGAFRIVDLCPPASVYFEIAGRDGLAFAAPSDDRNARRTPRRSRFIR